MTVRTKEEIREYNQKYYQKNKEYFKEQNKQWRMDNPERWRELCHKNRDKRVQKLRDEGCTNAWVVVTGKGEPKYKTKPGED